MGYDVGLWNGDRIQGLSPYPTLDSGTLFGIQDQRVQDSVSSIAHGLTVEAFAGLVTLNLLK